MKKALLLTMATAVALSSFAEKKGVTIKNAAVPSVAEKTTAIGDIDTAGHIFSTDTLAAYYAPGGADTGFATGMNVYGTKGFAERYSFSGGDSSVSVMGLLAEFTGVVNPASTKTVSFNAWTVSPRSAFGTLANVYNSGLPGTSIASLNVPITQLGISTTGGADTMKAFMFTTPSVYVPRFFIGFTINYDATNLGGDTIAVLSNLENERHFSYAYLSGTDTIVNNVNATMYADGSWHDNGSSSFGLGSHLFLFPIFKIGAAIAGVNSVTNNGITMFSSYPNPATDVVNIKFAVAESSEVTITVSNVAGQVVSTIKQNCAAGTQVVPVNTADLPAGNYVYLVRASTGKGMASMFTVAK